MVWLINLGLAHLCEFIEDCEHIELANRILHLLGKEGPRTQKPYKYIRFIYNRVLLEVATVRAGGLGFEFFNIKFNLQLLLHHWLNLVHLVMTYWIVY